MKPTAYAVPPASAASANPAVVAMDRSTETAQQQPGEDDRWDHEDRRDERGDRGLREGYEPARNGLDQLEDERAIVDLGGDRTGPDDQPDQRTDSPDHQGVEDLGRIGSAAPQPHEDPEQHRQCGEGRDRERPASTDQRAQGQLDDGTERPHRRTR